MTFNAQTLYTQIIQNLTSMLPQRALTNDKLMRFVGKSAWNYCHSIHEQLQGRDESQRDACMREFIMLKLADYYTKVQGSYEQALLRNIITTCADHFGMATPSFELPSDDECTTEEELESTQELDLTPEMDMDDVSSLVRAITRVLTPVVLEIEMGAPNLKRCNAAMSFMLTAGTFGSMERAKTAPNLRCSGDAIKVENNDTLSRGNSMMCS